MACSTVKRLQCIALLFSFYIEERAGRQCKAVAPRGDEEGKGYYSHHLREQDAAKASVGKECLPKTICMGCASEEPAVPDKDSNAVKVTSPESRVRRKETLVHTN